MKNLQEIVGQKCFSAEIRYADELVLDLGEKIPYNHPKLEGFKGSWILCSGAEDWHLEKENIVAWDLHGIRDYKLLPVVIDAIVKEVKVSYYNHLHLTFDNGYTLIIHGTEWYILAPENTSIRIGVSYRPSNIPLKEWQ